MKLLNSAAVTLLFLLCGCFSVDSAKVDPYALSTWQDVAIERHLAGETNQSLRELAASTVKQDRLHTLPDSARFVRESDPERAAALSRDILWQSAEFAMVQFSGDPQALVSGFRAGELRCQAALLISEKIYLDRITWKTADQEQRSSEVDSELSVLCGGIPFGGLEMMPLALPGNSSSLTAGAAEALSQDPAEAIQIAAAICMMPDEIRRQQLAEPSFDASGILAEIRYLAGSYALLLDRGRLMEAEKKYAANPTSENLWHFRRWYYRTELDASRMPLTRGTERDRQFINSMLLLQEGF